MCRLEGRGHGGHAVDGRTPGQVDYFISHNAADRAWAEWIAWELEAAGYSTLIEASDLAPGASFVQEVEEAI